jgi:predicted acylesterase/phospholipase RssA
MVVGDIFVFSGGGTRCLAYLFALKCLIVNNIIKSDCKKVFGTSAGSFIASLVALGGFKQIDKIISIACKTDFKKALNVDLMNIVNFTKVFGLDDKTSMKNMVKEILDLIVKDGSMKKFKDVETLNIVVADLTDAKTVVLNNKSYPEMFIVDGIVASMTLPFFYTPFIGLDKHMYIDGGLRANFPWDCLESDEERKEAIGFVFQTSEGGILGTTPTDFPTYIGRLINFDNIHVNLKNKSTWSKNIVFVNMPNYPAYYMNVKHDDLIELEHAGILGAKDYIKRNESILEKEDKKDKKDVIEHSVDEITQSLISRTEGSRLDHERTHHPSQKLVYYQESTDGKLDSLQSSLLCKCLSHLQHNHVSQVGLSRRRWSV